MGTRSVAVGAAKAVTDNAYHGCLRHQDIDHAFFELHVRIDQAMLMSVFSLRILQNLRTMNAFP